MYDRRADGEHVGTDEEKSDDNEVEPVKMACLQHIAAMYGVGLVQS